MGWVVMSERELNRIEILAQIDNGRLTVDNGANLLCMSRRQVFRLLKRYRKDGAPSIRAQGTWSASEQSDPSGHARLCACYHQREIL